MNRTKWIIFIVIVLGIFGVLIFLNQRNGDDFEGDPGKVISYGAITDRQYGSPEQKVTLIEYGDFQCPTCRSMYPSVKQLKEVYKDKLTFVFRNLPLTNIHPNALAAAVAAEAAGQQNKFWQMHDKLYENQPAWQSAGVDERGSIFEKYAQELELNIDQFKQDLSNPAINEKINRDRATARKLGATSTPTFVLNGQVLSEQTSVNGDELKKAIDKALEDAGYNLDAKKDQ